MAFVPVKTLFLHHPARQGVAGHVELRLDDTVVGRLPHHRRVRLRPEDEGQRTEQDGLAGAGLAGYDEKTRWKINIQRVYQNIIPYLERLQHDCYWASFSSPFAIR